MRGTESFFDYITALADPTGQGLITGADFSDERPPPMSRPIPVTIRNHWFPSYTAAAEAIGVTVSSVRLADRNGRLDALHPRHWWEIEGIEFRTLPDAASFFGTPVKDLRPHAHKKYAGDPLTDRVYADTTPAPETE